ncbi:hypothetical protein ML5_1405 [Micromonospora sp. L5]|uniref:hypothetical protein n=1 Tax=Micromonospora sp. (strain L5) TaxID=648999 RepID=UPI0001C46A38|nr:hypothetical protein [Micromonospora sp. L5]ADU06943.1 hypothetical protein ML5_1405 [Micromonospora sp. L5]
MPTSTPEPTIGQQLAAARHSPRTYAKSIVKRWPALTAAQRAEVSAILSPIVASQDGGK